MKTHLKPSFFIIGERKCGTSSLFRYLIAHPQVLPGKLKEPNYFAWKDLEKARKGFDGYLANFPNLQEQKGAELVWPELNESGILYEEKVRFEAEMPVEKMVTGEASANTLAEANPKVVRQLLPHVRLIAVMRDPIERTFSHYRMLQRFRDEGRKLSMPITDLLPDLKREIHRVLHGEYSELITPGLYHQNLTRWLECFPREQLLLVLTEDLADPNQRQEIMDRVLEHAGLPAYDYGDFLRQSFNVAPKAQMPLPARQLLTDFFSKPNRALSDLLHRELPWHVGG